MSETPAAPAPTLAARAYDVVEAMIVTLKLPPGHVFSEAALSRRIGIGRTPLREALQRLAAEGLVVALPRRGMMVTEIKLQDIFALLETRRVLDRLVAGQAARRATPEQREALTTCAALLRDTAARDDLDAFMRADHAGDDLLAAAARNPFAAQALAPLHTHSRRFWYQYRHEGDLGRSADLHARLLDAVAAGDPDAAVAASDALIDYLDAFARTVTFGVAP
ncbi:MAG: GntR family transcriptional regulator [Bacteroidetes bacterium]|nr:MAG: GntR family transcriptional regulator [Bacteroidota bacterium]